MENEQGEKLEMKAEWQSPNLRELCWLRDSMCLTSFFFFFFMNQTCLDPLQSERQNKYNLKLGLLLILLWYLGSG